MSVEVLMEVARQGLEAEVMSGLRLPEGLSAEEAAAWRAAGGVVDLDPTPSQSTIWLAEQQARGPGYGVHFALELPEDTPAARVRGALDALAARHQALRASWPVVDGRLVMRLRAQAALPLETFTLADPEAEDRLRRRLAGARVDLTGDPAMRCALVRAGGALRLWCFSHHITVDGAALMILARELAALMCGEALPPLPRSLADWMAEELRWLEARGEALAQEVAPALAALPPPELPRDRLPRGRSEGRGWRARRELPLELVDALRDLARASGCTPFRALFACFGATLGRWGGPEALSLGLFHGGRTLPGAEALVGSLVHTVPARLDLRGQPSLRALLGRAAASVGQALQAGRLPPERLGLAPERRPRAVVGAQLHPEGLALPPGFRLVLPTLDCAPDDTARFDLMLKSARRPDGGMTLELEADAGCFERGRAEALLEDLHALIAQGVEAPDMPGFAAPPPAALGGGPPVEAPSLWDAFGAQVAARPEAPAVVCPGGPTLRYADLHARALGLAAALRARGVVEDDVVAVCTRRGPELVAGIWAALAAGAGWLPVDPDLPAARQALLIEASGARVTLLGPGVEAPPTATPWLSTEPDVEGPLPEGLPLAVGPEALACLLFTSGSTGQPKGVEVPRRALDRTLAAVARIWRPAPGEVVAALTTQSFDISTVELIFPLLHGGVVRLLEPEVVRDPAALARALEGAALVQGTPTTLGMLVAQGWRPAPEQRVFSAGEPLSLALAEALAGGAGLTNLYGPTEATVFTTAKEVARGALRVTIGRPLPGYSLWVLGEDGALARVGQPGELLVGGAGLARGYRGRPDLTAERFIDGGLVGAPGERVYRTGDLVRALPCGEIEHLGRIDDQVKIRGNRVELGEIEAALAAQPGVAAAAAAPWRDAAAGDRVIAWVVPAPGRAVEEGALRDALARALPGYMVPSRVLQVAALPRTASGKVDRRALPLPEAPPPAPAAPVGGALVDRVARVQAEVLGIAQVDPARGFLEQGGTSIQLVQVAARLSEALGRDVRVIDLFDHPSAARLARWLEGERAADVAAPGVDEPLAVVGISLRLPGGIHSLEALAEALAQGLDLTGEAPDGRWDDAEGLLPTLRGGFLSDPWRFDHEAFGLTPREAAAMDPQHRMALELAVEALERAALAPGALAGERVGVFLGLCGTDYQGRAIWQPHLADVDPMAGTGAVHSVAAGRVAHLLDLRGPALVVDTACSSALVALHQAAVSLRRGECSLALAGGVNLLLSPRFGVSFGALGLLSPSGRCAAFGAGADGYARAEGGGFVVLAPLAFARARRLPVLALLRGSAINHDGRAASLTAPNGLAQQDVIRRALADAGLAPAEVGLVEAHGTGTLLGDPVEAGALAAVYGEGRDAGRPLLVGSVKSSLGHLEGAAGIAGLARALVALGAERIPATLHANPPNPHIAGAGLPLQVLTEATPWPEGPPRRAGVSAFGFSGTNAHVVLEAPPAPEAPDGAGPWPVLLSARRPATLRALAEGLCRALDGGVDARGLVATLALGRDARAWRAGTVVEDAAALRAWLGAVARGERAPRQATGAEAPGPGATLREEVEAWVAGADVQPARRPGAIPATPRAALPPEPFEGPRLSLPAPLAEEGRQVDHPIARRVRRLGDALTLVEGRVSLAELPALADHRVDGRAILPAVSLLELLRVAGWLTQGSPEVLVEGLTLAQPVVLPPRGAMRLLVQVEGGGSARARVFARPEGGEAPWTLHAEASLAAAPAEDDAPPGDGGTPLEGGEDEARRFLDGLDAVGVGYGPAFRALEGLERRGDRARARLRLPPGQDGAWRRAAHPALLDGALQALAALTVDEGVRRLPARVERATLVPGLPASAEARIEARAEDVVRGGLVARDARGRVVARLEGVQLRRAPAPAEAGGEPERWAVVWEDEPPGAPAAPPRGPVWVVGDPGPEGEALLDALEIDEERILLPERPLRAEALSSLPAPGAVVSLVALRPSADAAEAEARVADALTLARALAALPEAPPSLWVTRGAVEIDREGLDNPAGAAIWGTVRSLRQELGPRARLLDLDPAGGAPRSPWTGGSERALRGDRALRPRLRARAALEPVAPRGRWLVVGGLGGLGAAVVAWLRASPGVEEVLTLSRAEGGPGHLRVDLADGRGLAAALASCGPLDGVVHAADAPVEGTLARLGDDAPGRGLAAKVRGLVHLHEALAPEVRLVLFSSISGWLGPAGQGIYAAANAFMDAFAAWRRARGGPTVSIAWGPWAEVGMAARTREEDRARAARLGLLPLSPARALALLAEAPGAPEAVVGLARLDRAALLRAWSTPPGVVEDAPRAVAAPGAALAGEALREAIRAELAATLGVDPEAGLDWTRSFQDLGVDSILAVELRDRLSRRLGRALPATLVFDHPTLQAVAALVEPAAPAAEGPAAAPPRPSPDADDERVAIIGVGCRLPGGVGGPEELLALILGGVDAIGPIPEDRWDARAWYAPDPATPGRFHTTEGGFIEGFERFDAAFFGLSPREAEVTDPQHRLLLEVSWEAIEDAGLPAERLQGARGGVWLGFMNHDYYVLHGRHLDRMDGHFHIGNSASIAAGRLSYFYGMTGPAMTLDTACSSGLVGLHLACGALRGGECDLALAAGVSLVLSPGVNTEFSTLGGMSADGRCRSFSAGASGVGWSEGVVVLVLKRLADALRDGDRVHGVIRGSAVNQDGRSNGLTAPNGPAQEAVIRAALGRAGLGPDDLDYVEAHGTGTALGDPIEAGALGAVMAGRARGPLRMGSVKTHLGHTQAPSGLVSVVKVLLALREQALLPQLHFDAPSPHIPWAELPLEVVTRPLPWPRGERARRAGVSAFGVSGTNAHVIVEEPPAAQAPREAGEGPWLLPLSARSVEALRARARDTLATLREGRVPLADLLHTLAARRSALEHRVCVIGEDAAGLAEALERWLADGACAASGEARGEPPRVALLMPGHGAHHVGMLLDLAARHPALDEALTRLDAEARAALGWSPRALMEAPEGPEWARVDRLQPLRFVTDLALYALWRWVGLRPTMVIGHSQGGAAAACAAGALSIADGLRVIGARSAALEAARADGGLLAVELGPDEAPRWLAGRDPRLGVSVVNGARSVVIGGPWAALEQLRAELDARGLWCRFVRDGVVSHVPMVVEHAASLREALAGLRPLDGELPLYSPPGDDEEPALVPVRPDGEHFWRVLTRPVRFDRVVGALAARRGLLALECSPHPVLAAAIEEGAPGRARHTTRAGAPERSSWLEAVARLWCDGVPLDLGALAPAGSVARLPRYPWQQQPYLIDWGRLHTPADLPGAARRPAGDHPLLGEPLEAADEPGRWWWRGELSLARWPWLADHQVDGAVLLPGVAWAEAARAAGVRATGGPVRVLELRLLDALVLHDRARELEVAVRPALRGAEVQLRSRAGGPWTLHATARLAPARDGAPAPERVAEGDLGPPEPCEAHYDWLASRGLRYGPAFRGLVALRRGPGVAVGEVRCGPGQAAEGMALHPAALDACLHVLAAAAPRDWASGAVVPVGVEALDLWADALPEALHVHARWWPEDQPGRARGELLVLDGEGRPVCALRGVRLRALEQDRPAPAQDRPWLSTRWEALDAPTGEPALRRVGLCGHLPPGLAAALEALGVEAAPADPAAPAGLDALVWGAPPPGEQAARAAQGALAEGLALAQALERAGLRDPPRLVVVTRCGQEPGGASVRPDQAAIIGWARALANEAPGLRVQRLDLDDAVAPAALAAVIAEDGPEDEQALRGGQRLAPRLTRALPGEGSGRWQRGDDPVALVDEGARRLDALRLRARRRRPLAPGELRLRVQAVGLNFLDLLAALRVVEHGAQQPGLEAVGEVIELGEGVRGLQVGDRVIALGDGLLGSEAVCAAERAFPAPPGLSAPEAATALVAHATVVQALVEVARLQPGERVLVHAASGGVGVAAVQWARRLGARVFATAGSEAKRAWLRSQGVERVSDSRSDRFVDDVLAWTDGEGVDVVLNSLSGALLARGLDCLRPFGRFIELGKRDVLADHKLGLAPFLKNLSFSLVDLKSISLDHPARLRKLVEAALGAMAEGGPVGPLPTEVFPLSRYAEALDKMARAAHIGRLALVPDAPPALAEPDLPLPRDATWLITGGLGGLGLSLAEALVARGLGAVALLGRGGLRTEAQRDAVARMEAAGARVELVQVDVADPEALAGALAMLQRNMPPLRGVVHAAGVLSDGLIANQTPARYAEVLAPKVHGAWNLHVLTRELPLDAFVLYGSASALLGSPGQTAYAGANAFLDGLAQARRRAGLPALSLAWGAFSEVGLAAADARRGARIAAGGVRSLSPAEGQALFWEALHSEAVAVGVFPASLRQWVELMPAAAASPRVAAGVDGGGARDASLREAVLAAPEGRRRAMLLQFLQEQLAAVLRNPRGGVSPRAPFAELGVDSLMGLELRNRVELGLGERLEATLIWTHPTLDALADALLARLAPPPAPPPAAEAPPPPDLPDDPDELDADALAALLDARLLALEDEYL